MDYFFISLAVILVLLGIAGCLLPVLPGPPLSYFSLLLLQLTSWGDFNSDFLILWAIIAGLVTVMDYVLPVWVTRKTGGTKAGVWGALVGLLAGIFIFPPFGIIIGPFMGAMAGELIQGAEGNRAFRAGFGSFLGFLLGTGLKLISSLVMSWYFFKELFS